jgi:hypothetical protein
MAKGEWVWFVDSDDMVDMHFVADIVTWLKSHKDADFVMFDLDTFQDGEATSFSQHDIYSPLPNIKNSKNDFFLCNITYNHQQVWYRNMPQLRFTVGIRVAEDLELMYKYCMTCNHPVKFNVLLYHYRIHENSATQNTHYHETVLHDLPVVMDNLLKWMQVKQVPTEPWLDFRIMKLMQNLLYNASRVKSLKVREFQSLIKGLLANSINQKFTFANEKKFRLAKWNVRAYFLLNRLYLIIKSS